MFPEGITTAKLIIERSEFIGYLKRCDTLDEHREFLNAIKKKHHDATHVVSAYIAKDIKRSSDDGEPSGTAGIPVLSVLERNNLENTSALVVRYFGGIKLGAGGLVRAYSNMISETIKKAAFYNEEEMKVFELSLAYDLASKIDHYIRNNTLLLDVEYVEKVNYRFAASEISDKLLEYTKGEKPSFLGYKTIKKPV